MAADREEEEDHHLSPPSKHPRLISSDAQGDYTQGAVTMALPSPLTLGLRLGLGNGGGNANGNGAVKPAFTFMQLQELEHQALIYKYMSAGVPVPVHLVLPIWKSVAASSFGPHHYPSPVMGLGSLFFDYRNSMEPEPGRCRRTDGKKWRCSRDVVPGQKYCERHVHRGRGRSRKPVEGVTGSSSVPSSSHLHAGSRSMENGTTDNTGTQVRQVSVPAAHMHFLARASSTGTGTTDRVSPPRLGFSPTSVLQNAGVCRTGQVS